MNMLDKPQDTPQDRPNRRTFLQMAGIGAAGAAAAGVGASLEGCSSASSPITPLETSVDPKPASQQTLQLNNGVYALLDFEDDTEKEFAQRGLISAPEALEIVDKNGAVVWSQKAFAFLGETDTPAAAPDTANPSLWRNTQHNHIYGLFEVIEGVYQVRGYDMANITFVAGNTGWIVFDPLMSIECSKAAMDLVNENLGQRPVVAVVISHSHIDHFGGIKGIVTQDEVDSGTVAVIVPSGFEEHAVSENLYAGNAMGRRASYQYGTMLQNGEQGALSIGIGMGQSKGTLSYIAPTDHITTTGETREIDGVLMEFQLTLGTEAPAEMNTWFPQKKALWAAENCCPTLHNLSTLRGAQVRDGSAWAKYLMETLTRYGEEAEVLFVAHNWPRWGNEAIRHYLIDQAAMYKFINDQTLNYTNQGYTPSEIAYMIQLPSDLEKAWYTRQYYGTLAHNSRAVYQRYIGWYDANPVNLNPLPPSDQAARFVSYFGDLDAVLQHAKQDFDAGEYQWVAQVTNILVFDDPTNTAARNLCADALEQLAYQAESGTWRNCYLSGALELRAGTNPNGDDKVSSNADLARAMTPQMVFDYMNILLDNNAASEINGTINIAFADSETWLLTIRSGVILYQDNAYDTDADLTIQMPKEALVLLLEPSGEKRAEVMVFQGNESLLDNLLSHLDSYEFYFNIVEP